MTHELLPDLSENVISSRVFLCRADSFAPVGSVSLSGAFLLGLMSRRCVYLSDVLSVYLCEILPG